MIKFDNTEFLLGNIKYGNTTSVTVNISNISDNDITLEITNSSCSCTTGKIKDSIIKPNGKTQFTISLNTAKAGKGMNQVKSISLKYKLASIQYSQIFRIKVNII